MANNSFDVHYFTKGKKFVIYSHTVFVSIERYCTSPPCFEVSLTETTLHLQELYSYTSLYL